MPAAMTRRRLFKLSLLSGLALSSAALAARCGRHVARSYRLAIDPALAARLRCLSPKEFLVLLAAAARVLDGVEPAPAPVADVALWVDAYVARLDPGLREDVRGLLELLEHSPLLSGHAAPFTALPPAAQDRVLRDWEQSSLALRRQGFQAIKSMCCLGYYQDPRSFASIGYGGSGGALL